MKVKVLYKKNLEPKWTLERREEFSKANFNGGIWWDCSIKFTAAKVERFFREGKAHAIAAKALGSVVISYQDFVQIISDRPQELEGALEEIGIVLKKKTDRLTSSRLNAEYGKQQGRDEFMSKLDPAVIKKMGAAQLRAAIKELGQNPMSAEFGKGNEKKMKDWLLTQVPSKAKPPAKKVVQEPVGEDAQQAGLQEASDTALARASRADEMPPSWLSEWMQNIEIRMSTLESASKIVAGHVAPTQSDPYASIRAFVSDENGVLDLQIKASDVDTLTHVQLLAIVTVLRQGGWDLPGAESLAVRELREAVKTKLGETMQAEGAPEAETSAETAAETAAEGEQAAEEAPTWPDEIDSAWLEPGAVVRFLVPGEEGADPTLYEPCVVQSVELSADQSTIENVKVFIDDQGAEFENINDRFGEMNPSHCIGFSTVDLVSYLELPT